MAKYNNKKEALFNEYGMSRGTYGLSRDYSITAENCYLNPHIPGLVSFQNDKDSYLTMGKYDYGDPEKYRYYAFYGDQREGWSPSINNDGAAKYIEDAYGAKPVKPLVVKDNTNSNFTYKIYSDGSADVCREKDGKLVEVDHTSHLNDDFLKSVRANVALNEPDNYKPTGNTANWSEEDIKRIADYQKKAVEAWHNCDLANDQMREVALNKVDKNWSDITKSLEKANELNKQDSKVRAAEGLLSENSGSDFDFNFD